MTNNGTHLLYSNDVEMEVGVRGSIITRRRTFKVGFSCALPTEIMISSEQTVSSVMQHVSLDVGPQAGIFNVGMGLWTDETFMTQISAEHTVTLPENIFFAVVIEEDTDYVLQARRCWATGTSDPTDVIQYEFITDFCGDSVELNVYETLNVYSNGISKAIEISIESFAFKDEIESELYLHCEVRICDPTRDDCVPSCPANSRRRRRSGADDQTTHMAIGPIRIRQY